MYTERKKCGLVPHHLFLFCFLLSTCMHLKYTLKLEILTHWFQKEIVNTLWNSIKNDLKYILQVQVSLDTWKRLKISGKVSTFSKRFLDLLVNGPPHLLKEFLIHVQIILKIWNSSIHLTWNDRKKVVKFGGWKINFRKCIALH